MNKYTNVVEAIIKLFRRVPVNTSSFTPATPKQRLKAKSQLFKKGIYITENALKHLDYQDLLEVQDYLIENYGIDAIKLNSTFYKSIDDVLNLSDGQRYIDQLLHYGSNYGDIEVWQNFGSIFEPELLDPFSEIKFDKSVTLISGISQNALQRYCFSLVNADRALDGDTVLQLADIIEYYNWGDKLVTYLTKEEKDVSGTTGYNKDTLAVILAKCCIPLKNFDDFTKQLMFLATGRVNFVKNQELNNAILETENVTQIDYMLHNYYRSYGIKPMAQNVTRYRKQYLLLRKVSNTSKSLLNKVLRLSKQLYLPRTTPMLNDIVGYLKTAQAHGNYDDACTKLAKTLEEVSFEKLAKLYQYAGVKLERETAVYHVRNGKTFTKKDKYVTAVLEMITREARERFDTLKVNLKIPENIKYAVPKSQKSYLGYFPEMTTVTYDSDIIIGINWTTNSDLDLHAFASDGSEVGWNQSYGNYKDAPITFSGDMTNLNTYGFAAEYMRITTKLNQPVLLTVNNYWHGSVYQFFCDKYSKGIDRRQIIGSLSKQAIIANNSFKQTENALAYVEPCSEGLKVTLLNFGISENAITSEDIAKVTLRDVAMKVHNSLYIPRYYHSHFSDTPTVDLSLPQLNLGSFDFLGKVYCVS